MNSKFFYMFFIVYLIGGLTAVFVSHMYNWNKEHIGFAFLFGSLFQLVISLYNINIRTYLGFETTNRYPAFFKDSSHINKILFILLSFFLAMSVYSFSVSKQFYYLSLKYFIFIFIIILIISIQILISTQIHEYEIILIIYEILILSIIISASYLYIFPDLQGFDSLYHVKFVEFIINQGSIYEYFGNYPNNPNYHILFAITQLVTNINNIKHVQLVITIAYTINFLIIYLIVKSLFNARAALISILFVALSPYMIIPRYQHFPSSFCIIFFIIIFYLCLKPCARSLANSLILIILYISLIHTHPLIPVIIITQFILFFITSNLLNFKYFKVNKTIILFMLIAILTKWMESPIRSLPINDRFTYIILSIKDAIETTDVNAVTRATLAPLYSQSDIILREFGTTIQLFLGIAGALYILKQINNQELVYNQEINERVIIMSITTLSLAPLPYLLTLVYPQSLPARWFPYIEVLLSMFSGITILIIYCLSSKYKLNISVVLFISITLIFMITTPIANPHSQIYLKSDRLSLIDSEICAWNFVDLLDLSKQIHANSIYLAFIDINLSTKSNSYINPDNPSTYSTGYIVLRKYDYKIGFVIPQHAGKLSDRIYPNNKFNKTIYKLHKTYDNNDVNIYYM